MNLVSWVNILINLRIGTKILLPLALVILLTFIGCDTGKPVPTNRLEKVLPDKFGDYVLVNTVRNAGGPVLSEVTGHYKNTGRSVGEGIGVDGEIRIVVQDYGATKKSIQLPVAEGSDNFNYKGIKCYRGLQPGSGIYELRIPIGGRVLLRIEFDDIESINETRILDAINWDALKSIATEWEGLG